MQPLSLLWNARIFNLILSIMVTASQAIKESKVITSEESRAIKLSAELLPILGRALSTEFAKLAGIDVVLALIELAVKMSTIYQRSLDKHRKLLTPSAIEFLDAAAAFDLPRTMPSIVFCLLLDFLPVSKSITNSVVQIRKSYLWLCSRHFSDRPDDLLLVIKYVLMRSLERAAMRENTAVVVH
jgi:hypothetical protein